MIDNDIAGSKSEKEVGFPTGKKVDQTLSAEMRIVGKQGLQLRGNY